MFQLEPPPLIKHKYMILTLLDKNVCRNYFYPFVTEIIRDITQLKVVEQGCNENIQPSDI